MYTNNRDAPGVRKHAELSDESQLNNSYCASFTAIGEGAFTPTQKLLHPDVQWPFESRGGWSERTLPAFVSVSVDRERRVRTFHRRQKQVSDGDRRPTGPRSVIGHGL